MRKCDPRMKDASLLDIDANRPMRHAMEIRQSASSTRISCACWASTGWRWWWPIPRDTALPRRREADFLYLRLHGEIELYASGYTDAALDRWATRLGVGDGLQPMPWHGEPTKYEPPRRHSHMTMSPGAATRR